MNIGLAIYNFDPMKGGAERYAFDLATRLQRQGHGVYVFCSRGVPVAGIHLVPVDTIRYPRWLRTLSFALNHKKAVKQHRLDVILGFGNTLELDVYQSHGGVQSIWMGQEIASYDNPREQALKAFLLRTSINQKVQEWVAEYPIRKGRFKRIVAISDMVKNHMKGHFRLSEDAFRVIYNGVDTERFRPGEKEPDRDLGILFSAGNFRLKGLMPLLLALKIVSATTNAFHLNVMGRGRKERYNDTIASLGLRDHVTFLGESSSPDVAYREADILAHPTFYDACSLTTMEAMASGLPTITTRWNGASALVTADEGCVIDGPRDINELASAITGLFVKEKREVMGHRARLKMEQYTMDRNVAGIEKILYEVCDGTGRT